jgi:hypothetical protein
MKFVSDNIIDAVVDAMDGLSDDQYEKQVEDFAEAQPVLFAWLFSEQFDLLDEDEKGYLQYLSLIAWNSIVKANGGPVPTVSEEEIGAAEEKNYEVMEINAGKTFRERLNPFFENTKQEDLLAFAEDAVLDEEDDQDPIITKEGREPIFVALKTMVDVLTAEGR